MRVATYNVHRCLGRDGREDPSRIAEVVDQLQADIIGLQEVGTSWDGEAKLFELVSKTGLRATALPLVDRGAQWQGNALLTRYPIVDVGHAWVSVSGREPRGILDVVLGVGPLRVRVIVVHFGLQYKERKQQTTMLLRQLEHQSTDALVVMGDFNEWRPRSMTIAHLNHAMGHARPQRSFPTPFPVLALDRIWIQPGPILRRSGVLRSKVARIASDHFPVWVDLELQGLLRDETDTVTRRRARSPT